jgi:O-antigen/teichoic acid export membrane protein
VKNARNVAIVLGLAALVALIPAGGFAAGLLLWLLGIAFWAILAWFVARMYREYRFSLFSLDDRMRALLYVSIGVAVLTVTATRRLWDTSLGVVAWFALIAGASYGVFAVWQHARRY